MASKVSEDILAQLGKNGAYGATDASALTGLFTTVAQFLTSRKNAMYVLGYCTPKLAGQHELTLSIEGKGVSLPTGFDASGFDANGPTCSSAAFASACDGKGCGGELRLAVRAVCKYCTKRRSRGQSYSRRRAQRQ